MSAASSVGQRFSQLIQALGMSKNAFAISLDKTATVIQHLVDERNKPGFDLMNKVVDVYPNVSIEWLLRGKGPMMLNGANAPAAAEALAPDAPIAPAASKPAPATPNFPTPLFAVAAARQPAPVAPPLPAELPVAEPAATATAAAPAAIVQEAPRVAASQSAPVPVAPAATAPPEPLPAASTAQLPPFGPTATAAPAAAPDAAYITAALHAQHLQHQLALAEQRNQHLLEQQKLILERQALMQQMLDLMRRPV
jgi:hypothetical protein